MKPPPMTSVNGLRSSEMIVEQFSPAKKAGQTGLSNVKEMCYIVLPLVLLAVLTFPSQLVFALPFVKEK